MSIIIPKGFQRALDINDVKPPIPLKEADLTRSLIYWRGYGVFYVAHTGSHPVALSVMYKWKNKPKNTPDEPYYNWFTTNGLWDPESEADLFLQTTPGTCYTSTMHPDQFITWRPEHLTLHEHKYFKNLRFLNKDYY